MLYSRYKTGYMAAFFLVTLGGILVSLMIEYLQCFIPARTPGVSDVISNGIGSGMGMLVASTTGRMRGIKQLR